MISENLRKAVRPTSMLLTTVWLGELSTFAVYYLVVWMMSRHDGPAPAGDSVLPILFGALAAACVFGGIGFRFFAFSQGLARKLLSREQAGPALPGIDGLTEDERQLACLARGVFPMYVMALGMINSCAVFGMVLAMVLRDAGLFVPFVVAAMVGCALSFPRLESYLEETRVSMRHSSRRQE